MPCVRTDVAVIGAGPAGAAAALTLRRHAPGLSVSLLEAGDFATARAGEVLPAAARPLLDRLGVTAAFDAAGFAAGRALAAAWTGPELDERHSIFSAQGPGWHLDRARFDRLLADAAVAAGANLRTRAAVRSAAPLATGWRLTLADGGTVAARALVWASGRQRRLARSLGARVSALDHLAAYTRYYDAAPGDGHTVIEAVADGWWYSSDLADGRRVVACLTEPAYGAALRTVAGWEHALASTHHIAPLVPAAATGGDVVVRAAGTATLDPGSGPRWVSAGDTLFAADPLSSRGLIHALRSGILAAYATADSLDGREDEARRRLAMIHAHGFAAYRTALADYYALAATRFDTPFWVARRAAAPPMENAA